MEDKWEKRNAYIVLVGKRKGNNQLEDLDVDGRIKLNEMLKN